MPRVVIPVEVRFAQKYRVDEESGCWVWTAGLMSNGYAQFRQSTSKNGHGHRFAYEHFVGSVPKGYTIDHLCRNRACVNPEHLEAVPHRINVLRSKNAAAKNAVKTHCPKGHPYDRANTYSNPKTGRRSCRACMLVATKKWRAEHKDEHRAYQRKYFAVYRAEGTTARERAKAYNREYQRRRRLDPAVREREREYKRQLREDAKRWRESQKSDE